MDASLETYLDEHGTRQPTRVIDRPRLCAETGGHVVERPRLWPPRLPSQGKTRKNYASVLCQRCGANVIIYDPLQDGVRFAADPTPPPQAA
jgi:hypothetical protein